MVHIWRVRSAGLGSNASRLTLRVTRGVMLPHPRAKAMRHATAPISTLSSAACAALLLAERPSSTRTAFSCSRPAFTLHCARSRGWSWRRSSTRASEPIALCVYGSSIDMCSVREARASAMRRGPSAHGKEKSCCCYAAYTVTLQHFLFRE